MSLISEALRKARADAAEREGRRNGVPRALAVPPKRLRPGLRVGLLAAIVVVAAVAGAAIAWWATGRRTSVSGAETGAARGTPAPSAAAIGQAAAPTPAGAPEPAATRAPMATGSPAPTSSVTALAQGAAPAVPSRELAEHPVPNVSAAARPAEVVAAPTAPSTESRGAVAPERSDRGGERSFGLDADLGYAKLHLDFVVYRPGSPFASINGSQVMVGSEIEGFTVEEIGPESVRLRDRHGAVVLRIR